MSEPAPASPGPLLAPSASPREPAVVAPAPAPSLGQRVACGTLECLRFETSRAAFESVLVAPIAVLGVGESHPLKGTEAVVPAARRFADELLPALAGRASDLVLELLLPNPECRKASSEAAREQKVVTEAQASTNQNDYLRLGEAAKRLGLGVHALRPTCDDLARIAGAGPDAVLVSLEVITRLSLERLGALSERNARAGDPRMVVGYGGALHNDAAPRPGREAFSYGPELARRTGGRYVELDLVVPEYVKDTPAWRSLPYFDAVATPLAAGGTYVVHLPSPSFVLVFPTKQSVRLRAVRPVPAPLSKR